MSKPPQELVIGRKGLTDLLKSDPKLIDIIYVQESSKFDIELDQLLSLATCKKVNNEFLDKLSDGINHQGVIAQVKPKASFTLEDLIEKASSGRKLLLGIDQIQDPHNLGAVLRVADAMGVDGLFKTERHCASEHSATVTKTSCGASHFVPIATVNNLASSIKTLKKEGFWIVGSSLDSSSIEISTLDANRPIVLILGGEDKGMRKQTQELCDYLVHIPMLGRIQSLNVSTASSILLYEINRLRSEGC